MRFKHFYLLICVSDLFYNLKTLKTGDEDLIELGENQTNKQKPNKELWYKTVLLILRRLRLKTEGSRFKISTGYSKTLLQSQISTTKLPDQLMS